MSQANLLQQIDDLVASKTFNLDALDSIKKLKDDLKKTLDERDALQKRYDGLYDVNNNQGIALRESATKIAELKAELTAAQALNEAGQKAIYDADKHKAVAEAWQSAMQTVFKPNAVRETIARNVAKPVEGNPGGNGYCPSPGFLANGQESETITREDA